LKRQVCIGAALWTLFITVLHIQFNVGWGALSDKVEVMRGTRRAELIVGFLPVT